MQEAMLFQALYDSSSSAHFEQSYYHISGKLNVHIFEAAWNEIIRRHDILRTIFVYKGVPRPLQIVLRQRSMDFHFKDIRLLSQKEQDAYCEREKQKDRQRTFDLSKDVLTRLSLFQTGDKSFNVLWSFHHILMDGWSGRIIYDECYRIYKDLMRGTEPVLSPAVPFARYIRWLKEQDKKSGLSYWREYLRGYVRPAGLPRAVSQEQTAYHAETFCFELDEATTDALRRTASENHTGLNTVIQSAWGILLGKCNGLNDVVFGAVVSGRPAEIRGIVNMVGLLINLIPVRIRFTPSQSFKDIMLKVHDDSIKGKACHYCSLARIQAETPLRQNLLDHVLVFENYPEAAADFSHEKSDETFTVDRFEHADHTNYDLNIQITPGKKLFFRIIYNSLAYDPAIIGNIEILMSKIVGSVIENYEIKTDDIKILESDEKEKYLDAAAKRQIHVPDRLEEQKNEFAPPENDNHKKLIAIWEEILEIGNIGIDDDYIELGGHSIAAIRIISRIHKDIGAELELREFFGGPTIRNLGRLIEKTAFTRYEEIKTLGHQPHYDVSHSQKRLWILDKMEDDLTAYNLCSGYLFEGRLDYEAFSLAFRTIVRRHESLRTNFLSADSMVRQKINPDTNFAVRVTDLRQTENNLREAERIAAREASRPFDLEKDQLIRVRLLRLSQDRHVLIMTIHHIVFDGWSHGVLVGDLAALYNTFAGLPSSLSPPKSALPRLRIQYKEYSAWQNKILETGKTGSQAFWHNELGGRLPVTNLPTDFPRPGVFSYRGKTAEFVIDSTLTAGIRNLARENRVSLFMTLAAALKALIYRHTGQNDIIIGTPVAGRNHPDLENQIGFYVNTLGLRDEVRGEQTLSILLSEVGRTTARALEHQIYPFDRLVRELNIPRDPGRSPVFDVMLVLQNNSHRHNLPDGLKISPFDFETDVSQFDLTFNFAESSSSTGSDTASTSSDTAWASSDTASTGSDTAWAGETPMDCADRLFLRINYSSDLFEPDTIKRMASHFEELIRSAVRDSHCQIRNLNILSEAEKRQILVDFNDTQSDYPADKTITDLFEEQAQRTPDNIAVISGDKCLTYREVNEMADNMAFHLRKNHRTEPDDLVAVITHRNERMIISLLGIMKAGGAYLPIDPEYPQKRIDYMMEDSGCKVLLSDEIFDEYCNGRMKSPDLKKSGTSDLAYVIYTSGSTGQPKGVMIEHGGFVNMISAQISGFEISEKDRVLQFASPSFDASLSEIFMALLKGAALVLVKKDTIDDKAAFLRYVKENNVSVITFPPVYLKMLEKHPLPTVRTIITAGEPAIKSDMLFYSKNKHCFNAFGPTETSVCTSFHRVDPESPVLENKSSVPIGGPITNSSFYVLDEALNPVPIGLSGEICFSGPGLSRGYLNKAELTREKFVDNPFVPGTRLYKTGDMGRWLPDGNVEFQGRKDDQQKIRGHRVEPGEIQGELIEHPEIKDALVLPRENELVAYIVIESGNTSTSSAALNADGLRRFLRDTLPSYMIPTFFVFLEKFPLTVNGKIDKKALPHHLRDMGGDVQYVAPRNETEEKIARVWKQFFARDRVGIHDNFFDMGGDSIRAIQIISHLHRENIAVRAKDILLYPTIALLSDILPRDLPEKVINHIDQGPVTGTVPLTAISSWFFREYRHDRHHFNHVSMFHPKETCDADTLRAVFAKLYEHHDALRLRYRSEPVPDDNGGMREKIIQWHASAPPPDLKVLDFTDMSQEMAAAELRRNTERLHTEMDLGDGPLMKVALFRMNDGDRLLVIIHHLVFDRISWSIFTEDLNSGYVRHISGHPISFPPKADSFKKWAEHIRLYSSSDALMREKPYWHALESEQIEPLPYDSNSTGKGLMGDIVNASVVLSVSETEQLLAKADRIYGAKPDEVLLAALAYAMKKWHGSDKTLVSLEGHGREDIIEGADVSRTIGWFTSMCPVILELPGAGNSDAEHGLFTGDPLAMEMETIKNMLRSIPCKGIGYGILKYLTPPEYKDDMTFCLNPEINFNYLGQFRGDDTGFFEIAKDSPPVHSCGPNAEIIHNLDIAAMLANGKLRVNFAYNSRCFKKETIDSILADYLICLAPNVLITN